MANLGTGFEAESLCAKCGGPIVLTFMAHGDSQKGLAEAMYQEQREGVA